MSLRDFLNWFEGISENIEAAPTEKQWGRIKEKLLALKVETDGSVAPIVQVASERCVDPPIMPRQKFQRTASSYPFFIDAEGYAKNKAGDRILAADVTDILYDLRGMDGDAAAIIWADDSTGLLNAGDIAVSAA
jgi:hypothetical protein